MADAPVSAAAVRQAVRGVMSAFPKGTRFAGCVTRIEAGAIVVDVTVAPDSVQVGPAGGPDYENQIRERVRRASSRA